MKTKNLNPTVVFLWAGFLILLLVSMMGKIFQNNGLDNLYTYQAQSFLNGKLNIEEEFDKIPGETVLINGKYYSIFPFFPTLLLLPFVAVFGGAYVKVSLIALIISLSTCYLLYKILQRLEMDAATSLWAIIAFTLGTAYWQNLYASNRVWMFAQIVSACFIFFAINESLGKAQGILAGLFLGLAFLSRQLSIYSSFFIMALLWQNAEKEKKKTAIIGFLTVFGVCVLTYLAFNYAQLGEITTGYSKMDAALFGEERLKRYGLFNTAYFFFNAVYMFLQGFHLDFGGADHLQLIAIDPFGASIASASPFIIAAFFSKLNRLQLWGAWLSITLALAHMLFYFNNGYIQYNAQRFSLDFMPILIILIALGLKNSSKDLSSVIKGMIVYAVFLNLITLMLVR